MTRLAAAVLLLCAQVLAVFGTGNLILCVHDDGECAIEFVGSECCREAWESERRAPPSSEDAPCTATASVADRCHDVPWQQDQTLLAHGPRTTSAPRHEMRAALPAIVAWTNPSAVFAAHVERLSVRGPRPEAVPRRARPFVLRC